MDSAKFIALRRLMKNHKMSVEDLRVSADLLEKLNVIQGELPNIGWTFAGKPKENKIKTLNRDPVLADFKYGSEARQEFIISELKKEHARLLSIQSNNPNNNYKIQVIKMCREMTGQGLAESKMFVEKHIMAFMA